MKLAIIEKIAVEFQRGDLNYLASRAFNKCWHRKEANKLLLILPGAESALKNKDITPLIDNNFMEFNKMLVIDNLRKVNDEEDYILAIEANLPYQKTSI